jgi:hypothetical protein
MMCKYILLHFLLVLFFVKNVFCEYSIYLFLMLLLKGLDFGGAVDVYI